ncbi:hypothetical protein [Sinomonas mesophila]|nr:hypothetical protein [Sinomonas mesophila]
MHPPDEQESTFEQALERELALADLFEQPSLGPLDIAQAVEHEADEEAQD